MRAKLRPIRYCQNPECGKILNDVRRTSSGKLVGVYGYDQRKYCSHVCNGVSERAGNPSWLREYHPEVADELERLLRGA